MRARPSILIAVGTTVLSLGPIGIAAAAAGSKPAPVPTPQPFLIRPVVAPVRAAQVDPEPAPRKLDPHNPADYVDPIDNGHVISPYGYRSGRRHEGIDFKSTYGAPVFATFPGTVLQAGPGLSGYGYTVTIDAGDGVTLLFAHLTSWSVKRGDVMKQGERIGAEGATGNASTYHVHYEVREDGVPRDPAPYLSGE
jgi:murein DD-endopeptidase MepM/ murein hydrolase activator NlpD